MLSPSWQPYSMPPCSNGQTFHEFWYNHQYRVDAYNQQHSYRQLVNGRQSEYFYGYSKNLFKIENTELCCRSCNQHFNRELTLNKHLNSRKHAMRIKSLTKIKRPYNRRMMDKNGVEHNQLFSEIMSKETLDCLFKDLEECFNQKEQIFGDIEPSNLPDLLEFR